VKVDFRIPYFSGSSKSRQEQLESYLQQFIQELNYALGCVEGKIETVQAVAEAAGQPPVADTQKAVDTFNSVKELIIKSADIIQAYEEAITIDLTTEYVAESDYGLFKEWTEGQITATASNVTQNVSRIETLEGEVNEIRETSGYIKSGILDGGVIGVEVGQTEGTTFTRFARFTASGIYFYTPSSSDPVAWMTGNKLYVANAEITSTIKLGGYIVDVTDGLAFRWGGNNA